MSEQVPPQLAMWQLIFAGWNAQALRSMVMLRLADHLADGPRLVDELAVAAGVDGASLARLVDLLAGLGLVDVDRSSATVTLTPMGALLCSDRPDSLHAAASLMTAPWLMRVWEALPDAIRSGGSVFPDVYGSGIWDYLADNPDDAAVFDAGMTASVPQRAAAIEEACDLTDVTTVVDVGGGHGRLLAALLTRKPHLRGVVADRPDALAGARLLLAETAVDDRCDVAEADFFAEVPSGGDVFVLAQILHDWPDAEAVAILRVCAAAMAPGARLLIVEQVLPDGRTPDLFQSLGDINMLINFGAKERTAGEYQALLEHAGFGQTRVLTTRTAWTVFEALKP